mmetsp:Transcript_3807/g.12713  ORF Transcript_3807/g.12713 Transcript_3807/m.12713 type:complete len:391 (-) Transcript_3807:286-1458(-)
MSPSGTMWMVVETECSVHGEHVLAALPHAHPRHRDADHLLDEAHVLAGLHRERGERFALGDVFLPAGHSDVLDLHVGEVVQARGHARRRERLAVQLVADADAQLRDAGEHIELGDVYAVVAVDERRVLDHLEVEPAAPARAARRGAVLAAHVPEALARGVRELRGEGPRAHAGGVGLHYADGAVDLLGRDAEARAHAADGRAARRDEGEGAKVYVQEGGVGPLDEEPGARGHGVLHEAEAVHDLRLEQLGVLEVPLDLVLDVHGLHRRGVVDLLEGVEVAHPVGQRGHVKEVRKADAVAVHLGGVAWADAALRGAQRAGGRLGLLQLEQAINFAVRVEENLGAVGDEDPLERVRVKVLEVVELLEERGDVHHDAVADHVARPGVDHAAGQ